MILNIIKPKGITSHDVINKVRRITGERRVGHGGTLDPLAQGVLVVAVGRDSTKKLEPLLKDADKEYIATIELGKISTTDDAEGEIEISGDASPISEKQIMSALQEFTGKIRQTPPVFSAIKIKGKPAYKLARRGKPVELKERTVQVKEIELINFRPPLFTIRTLVSSGTYIRSLARDIGKALGVGGYLKELVRTRVGDFHIEDSVTLDELANKTDLGDTKSV
ncbi:MAG: tRNA pseudouridine(55) synthase TruB [Candidatus Colwellbacteria bacterium]